MNSHKIELGRSITLQITLNEVVRHEARVEACTEFLRVIANQMKGVLGVWVNLHMDKGRMDILSGDKLTLVAVVSEFVPIMTAHNMVPEYTTRRLLDLINIMCKGHGE